MTARRALLQAAAVSCLPLPAWAAPDALQAAIRHFTGGITPREGRVRLDVAPLVDNGNVVPVAVQVHSAMTADEHVQRIGLFSELNPRPDVAVFHLGPHSGVARVATRMRLATTQTLTAVAVLNDGSAWQQRVAVLVTLAACVET